MDAKYCLSNGSSDVINTLPQAIIENILCLLPIEEAARTSILSREWRYKWTTIPKLVFGWYILSKTTNNETRTSDITSARKNMDERCKLFYVVYQVLLLHQGPIHDFTLHNTHCNCFEIDQIILYLSRNHALKRLQLWFIDEGFYKLPLCAFSLHHLTYLKLCQVDLDHQPIFGGFPNLRSLNLYSVSISTKALLHLLSNSPSLTSFTLWAYESIGNKECTINELFECLPVIELLDIYVFSIIQMLILDSVPKEFPISPFHLKYVCLREMWLAGDGLRFLYVLLKSSPNLEKITLELDPDHIYDNEIWSDILEEYSNIWLEHLSELRIGCFCNRKLEIEFVKFILASSPKLKKVWIWVNSKTCQEELEMLKVHLQTSRVSHVEIVVKSVAG